MANKTLRILFAGTPEFAALHLAALLDSEHDIIGVYTQPDRPAGRGKKLTPSPVKTLALGANVPVYQPQSLKQVEAQEQLASLGADVLVVVAYGLILPQAVLDAPRFGCLNVHGSLLPRWRGAAPIQRAIEAGDRYSGITIMQMDAGLDTGAMLAKSRCDIGNDTTAATLHDELATIGAPLLLAVLADLEGHQGRAETQDDADACYASKIAKAEARIDWSREAADIDRAVRAFNPFPVCFTTIGGDRLKIWQAVAEGADTPAAPPGTITRAEGNAIEVACGKGVLAITRAQLPGGKPLSAREILNARAGLFNPGTVLGERQ